MNPLRHHRDGRGSGSDSAEARRGVPGVGPEVTGVAQGAAPALAGASGGPLFGATVTSAKSVRPWSSVTVTRTVIEPEVGAMTVAVEVPAPVMEGGLTVGATTVQAKVASVRPQAAALADAFNETFWPGATLAGSATAAIGRSAAATEPAAFAMPAPQVSMVQRHWASWKS